MTDPCRAFEEQLLDLIYDELVEADAKALHMHAASCHHCRTALEEALMVRRLASQLPGDDPPKSIDDVVLSEASRWAELQKESVARAGADVPLPFAPGSRGRPQKKRLWVPAFAAAALAASVAVVSIVLVRDAEQMSANESPAPDRVAMESKREPAPPDRFSSSPASSSESTSFSKAPNAPAQMDRLDEEAPAETPEAPAAGSRLRASARAPAKDAASGSRPEGLSKKKPERSGLTKQKEAASSAPLKLERKSKAKTENHFAKSPPASRGVETSGAARARTAPPRPDPPVTFEEASRAYDRGDCQTAIRGFAPWADTGRVDPQKAQRALLGLARCESRRGRCSRAVLWYSRLLERSPSHPSRPSLLWEAAMCERKLGRVEIAKKYLQELTVFPAWKKRAEQQLRQLDD